MSLGAHLLGLALFLSARPPPPVASASIAVTLMAPEPAAPAPPEPKTAPSAKAAPAKIHPAKIHAAKARPAKAAPAKPTPIRLAKAAPRPVRPLHRAPAVEAVEVEVETPPTALSAAQLSGAVTAGGGSGADLGAESGGGGAGGGCDMARIVQTALRQDPLVRAAVSGAYDPARSAGKAYLVWNGDWVRSGAEAGKGLAAVREALMWAVAFAPAACRAQPVHGLVLMSLNDGPPSVRLALGAGDWRWSNLLSLQGGR